MNNSGLNMLEIKELGFWNFKYFLSYNFKFILNLWIIEVLEF